MRTAAFIVTILLTASIASAGKPVTLTPEQQQQFIEAWRNMTHPPSVPVELTIPGATVQAA